MTEIVLIRHAESIDNKKGLWSGRTNCNLTEAGRKAAHELGQHLKNDFNEIYCSPLTRTKETLKEIFPDVIPIYDERLVEISIGSWEQTKKEDYDETLKSLFRQGIYSPPNGEYHQDVDERITSFLTELFETKQDKKILVVTHNAILRAIKRNFIKDYKNIMSKNLEMITLTEENYNYYKNHKKQDIENILKTMELIEYGYENIKEENFETEFPKQYKLLTPEELIVKRCGVCWDQVELERVLMETKKIKIETYFIYIDNKDTLPSHTFLVYYQDNQVIWLEHAWNDEKGIHPYSNIEELLNDVERRFIESREQEVDKNCPVHIYRYDKPPYHITCDEFYQYIKSQIKIK